MAEFDTLFGGAISALGPQQDPGSVKQPSPGIQQSNVVQGQQRATVGPGKTRIIGNERISPCLCA